MQTFKQVCKSLQFAQGNNPQCIALLTLNSNDNVILHLNKELARRNFIGKKNTLCCYNDSDFDICLFAVTVVLLINWKQTANLLRYTQY